MPPLSTLNFLRCPAFWTKTECGQNTLKSLKNVFQTLLKNWSGLKIFTAPLLPLRGPTWFAPPVECRPPHLVNNEASHIYKNLVNFEVLLLQGAFIRFWGAFIREMLLRDKRVKASKVLKIIQSVLMFRTGFSGFHRYYA